MIESEAWHGLSATQLSVIRDVLHPYTAKIERVALFGSRATGRYRPESDIDLVLYGALAEDEIARIHTLFLESSLSVGVDVVAYALMRYEPLREHIDAVAKTLPLNV